MFQLLQNTLEISLSKKRRKMYCEENHTSALIKRQLEKHTLFPLSGLDPDSAWTHAFVCSRTDFPVA